MDRLRLSEFTKWIGEERETFRSILNRGEAPIAQKRPDEAQRTYDGADLLAWCLFTILRSSGLTAKLAAETLRNTGVVDHFFREMKEGTSVSDWLVYSYTFRRDYGAEGKKEFVDSTYGCPQDLADHLQEESEGYGTPNTEGRIRLGMVLHAAVPIWPCYERCRATAEAHGFKMVGPDLFEIET